MRRTSPQRVLSCFLKFSTASAHRTFSEARPPTWNAGTNQRHIVLFYWNITLLQHIPQGHLVKPHLNESTAAVIDAQPHEHQEISRTTVPCNLQVLFFIRFSYPLSPLCSCTNTSTLYCSNEPISLQGSIKFALISYLLKTWEALPWYRLQLLSIHHHWNTVHFSMLTAFAWIFVIDEQMSTTSHPFVAPVRPFENFRWII